MDGGAGMFNLAARLRLRAEKIAVNLRRGFFRLWLVVSALWVVGVGVVAAFQFNSVLIPAQDYVMTDATSGFFKIDKPWTVFQADFVAAHWSVSFPNNVTLFVVNGIPESVVQVQAENFAAMYSAPRNAELRSARLNLAGVMLLVALAPAIVLLALGAVSGWMAAGFKS